jgi:hypothetical protein
MFDNAQYFGVVDAIELRYIFGCGVCRGFLEIVGAFSALSGRS